MRNKTITSLVVIASLMLGACATDEYGNKREMTDAEKGALIGAGIGGLLGLGAKNKNRAVLYGIVGGRSHRGSGG